MATGYHESDEIESLLAYVAMQKQIIQSIFKSGDFSDMPTAQQHLGQMKDQLQLLRYKACSAGGDALG